MLLSPSLLLSSSLSLFLSLSLISFAFTIQFPPTTLPPPCLCSYLLHPTPLSTPPSSSFYASAFFFHYLRFVNPSGLYPSSCLVSPTPPLPFVHPFPLHFSLSCYPPPPPLVPFLVCLYILFLSFLPSFRVSCEGKVGWSGLFTYNLTCNEAASIIFLFFIVCNEVKIFLVEKMNAT